MKNLKIFSIVMILVIFFGIFTIPATCRTCDEAYFSCMWLGGWGGWFPTTPISCYGGYLFCKKYIEK